MKSFMGLSLYILGVLFILTGLVIIIFDKFYSPSIKGASLFKTVNPPNEEPVLKLVTDLINAVSGLLDKIVPKERVPVLLIFLGVGMCSLGWLIVK